MPCNLNQLELAAAACDGVEAAGGVPLPFDHGVFARYRRLVGSASDGAVQGS